MPTKQLDENEWLFVSSKSRTTDTMKNIFSLFSKYKWLPLHGNGAKTLKCLQEDAIYLLSGMGK